MDYVGLNIGGDASRCREVGPQGQQCELPAGHDGPHRATGSLPEDTAAPACPDCGGPMEHAFTVDAATEEMARRVYASYTILLGLPEEALTALLQHRVHLHLAEGSGADCALGDGGDDAVGG